MKSTLVTVAALAVVVAAAAAGDARAAARLARELAYNPTRPAPYNPTRPAKPYNPTRPALFHRLLAPRGLRGSRASTADLEAVVGVRPVVPPPVEEEAFP